MTEKVTEAPKPSNDWAKNLNKTEKAYYNLLLGKFTENDIKVVRQDIFDYANKKFGGKTGKFDLQVSRGDVPSNHKTVYSDFPFEFYIWDDLHLNKNSQGFMKGLSGCFTFGFSNTPFGIEYSTVTGQKINDEPTREKLDAIIADAHAVLDDTIYHAVGFKDGSYFSQNGKYSEPTDIAGLAFNLDWVRSQEDDPTCFDFYIPYSRYTLPTREDLYW